MQFLSSSLSIAGNEVDKIPSRKVALTIPSTGWVANAGNYAYKLDVAISGVLVTDEVNVNILPDYQDIAQTAQLAPYVEEYNGGITFYAKTIPSSGINSKYTISR